MFAAGVLAPPSVKAPLESFSARARALVHDTSATPPLAAKPGATYADAPAQAANAASTPIASLLVPVPPPAAGHYALQAATFASQEAAAIFAAAAAKLDYKTTIVPISDAGQPFIVAVGDYRSVDAADADQFVVQRQLQTTVLPPVILLPAVSVSASTSAPVAKANANASVTAAAPTQGNP